MYYNSREKETGEMNCQPEYQEHADHSPTGRKGTNPITGDEFEIYRCSCGRDEMEIFTQYL